MSITYTWTFPQLNVQTSAYGQTDVVYNVNYVVTADDGDGHTAQAYGSCSIPYIAEDSFVPYLGLTPSIVQEWVTTSLGTEQVGNIEASLSTKIADQINPPTATLPPPWG
jgi:hypothetical protein